MTADDVSDKIKLKYNAGFLCSQLYVCYVSKTVVRNEQFLRYEL